jgi:hypothetical protein
MRQDYDKSFEVRMNGRTMISTHSSAQSRRSRRYVLIADAASSGTACSTAIQSSFCCVHCAEEEGVKGLRDRD